MEARKVGDLTMMEPGQLDASPEPLSNSPESPVSSYTSSSGVEQAWWFDWVAQSSYGQMLEVDSTPNGAPQPTEDGVANLDAYPLDIDPGWSWDFEGDEMQF